MRHSMLVSFTALALTTMLTKDVRGAEQPSKPPRDVRGAEQPSKPPREAPPAAMATLDHRFQVGIATRAGTGYRVIMPYNEEDCGKEGKSVCGSRVPVWLEISPSFGVTRSLEVLADVRLYLEKDFTETRGFFVAPGIKYYTDPADLFKFYFTGQVVIEKQDQPSDSNVREVDVGIRSALGLQFDVLRYVGVFAQGGILVGFERWLTFAIDGAAGVQVRY